MKVIFDSEEERDNLIDGFCPHSVGLVDTCDIEGCGDCWNAAILNVGTVNNVEE